MGAIETEKAKKELAEDEQSIKAYFGKFLYANLDDHEVRDMVLGYFVDKIYLYDDKVILTCKYSDADYEVDWEDFQKAKKAASGKVRPSRALLHARGHADHDFDGERIDQRGKWRGLRGLRFFLCIDRYRNVL